MDQKTAMRVLGMVVPNNSRLMILKQAMVETGVLRATNLDQYFVYSTGTTFTGAIDAALYRKTNSLEMAKTKNVDVDEFPSLPTPNKGEIPVSKYVFDGIDLNTLAKYASYDDTRLTLNGIYFDAERGYAVATDGHRLRMVEWKGFTRGFILPIRAAKLLALVQNEIASAQIFVDEEGEPGKKTTHHRHMQFVGQNWRLIVKLIEGPYPNYMNVIPKNGNPAYISEETRSGLIKCLDVLKPVYQSKKTRQVILRQNWLYCASSDIEKWWKVKAPGTFMPKAITTARNASLYCAHQLKAEYNTAAQLYRARCTECGGRGEWRDNIALAKDDFAETPMFEIGFNGDYLREILTDNRQGDLSFGRSALEPVVFTTQGPWSKTLLMPLRIMSEQRGECDWGKHEEVQTPQPTKAAKANTSHIQPPQAANGAETYLTICEIGVNGSKVKTCFAVTPGEKSPQAAVMLHLAENLEGLNVQVLEQRPILKKEQDVLSRMGMI